MASAKPYDVFLSHNSADKAAVETLARRLREEGLNPFLDKWHLIPGEPWQEALEEALDQSCSCAVFLGPAGLGTWENEEMRAALDIRVRTPEYGVIPVYLPGSRQRDRGRLPHFLQRLTWVDFRAAGLDDPQTLHELICGIQGVAPGPEGVAEVEAVCPFRGLQVFDEEHSRFFFGRDALTQHLVEQLREDRFLAVIGPSGSGKSSLVRAGLLPQVRAGALPASDQWRIVVFKPGPHPLEALAARLLPHVSGDGDRLAARRSLLEALGRDERGLHSAIQVALASGPDSLRLLLVVDQFEEVFTLCRDESARGGLIANLLYASGIAGGQAVAVITMRADFFGKCAAYPALATRMAERDVLVGPMTEEELRRAIEGPAAVVGLSYYKGLVDTILDDLGDEPGTLPLLEHTLLELWELRRGEWLTTDAYYGIGGVRGALAQRADAMYMQLKSAEQETARQVLLRLTQPGEGTEDTRRRASLSELLPDPEKAQVVETVIRRLADARLVTTDRDPASGEELVDVAHEALIRGWSRLRGWVDEDRAGLLAHRRLTEAAQEWERHEREESYLYRGARLVEAEEWAEAHAEDLNPLERDFVEASVALRERERGTARQRVRRVIAGLVAGLIIISSLALFSLFQRQAAVRDRNAAQEARSTAVAEAEIRATAEAEAVIERNAAVAARVEAQHQSRLALSRQLAAQVPAVLESDPEVGLLLAMEAVSVTYQVDGTCTLEADGALRQALASPFRGTLRGDTEWVLQASFSPNGKLIVTANNDGTARVWDREGQSLGILTDHVARVNHAVFSPDGRFILTANWDNTARLWDLEGRPVVTFTGHTGWVNHAVFSPDGQLVVTASTDHKARLWDREGHPVATLSGHRGEVNHASFSPDGELIVTASDDSTARLWDLEGRPVVTLTGHTGEVNHAAFSPDGKVIVTYSYVTARLWNLEGLPLATLGGYPRWVRHAAFSPDGELIVTSSDDGTARLWDREGRPLVTLTGHTDTVNHAAFSPNGELIVTASDDETARLWDITGQPLATLTGYTDGLDHAAFSPDGKLIVTLSWNGTARLWDIEGQSPVALSGHRGEVNHASFSPNGELIVTASDDETARLWDREGQPLATLGGYPLFINHAAFSPDGELIVTSSHDDTAQLWDIEGRLLDTLDGHEDYVVHAAFSPDGELIVTASWDDTARLWDREGQVLDTLDGHEDNVVHAAFSPDGELIVTASGDDTARLWDKEGQPVATLSGHELWVDHAAFSPDGELIVTASGDDTARLWDREGQLVATLGGHSDEVNHAAFSPDGELIVTASGDGTARLWSIEGQPVATLDGHTEEVNHAAFSPNGELIVTASDDWTARLWDREGQPVATLTGHELSVNHAAFSPDGQLIVTASDDHTARLHYVDIEAMMEEAQRRVARTLTPEERAVYLGELFSTPEPTVSP